MAEHEHEHDEKEHKKGHGAHGGGHGHGGGGHEEHEGAPEWLISFADNVTLMMGFFVIMTAVNMGPKGGGADAAAKAGDSKEPPPALLDTQIAIREAFHNPINMNSMDPNEQMLVQRIMERKGRSVSKQDGPRGDEHNLQSIRPSNYFKLCGAVPFDDGKAELSDAARQTTRELAAHLKGLRMIVDVRGHVSAAEAFEKPDQAMRLSFDRAIAVANVLAEAGVDWRRLRIVACADNDRVKAITYQRTGHRPNERVEVVLTDEIMRDSVPTQGATKSE